MTTRNGGVFLPGDGRISRRQFARGGALVVAGGAVGAAAGVGAANASDHDAPVTTPADPAASSSGVDAVSGLTGWDLPRDWGQSWRRSLARASRRQGTAACAVVGDSVGFGYWSSDLVNTSWAGLLRQKLTDVAGNGGSGFASQAHAPAVIFNPNSGVSNHYAGVPGNVWQQTKNWQASANQYGPGAGSVTSGDVGATLASTFDGTQLGIWYLDGGGRFTVGIDGTDVGTVTPGTSYAPAHRVFDVPKGRAGTHTWRILAGSLNGSGQGPHISGVEGLAKTGARVDNFSFPGLYSRAWANQDSWHSGAYAGGWRNPADLVIYELGGNDVIGADPDYPNGTPPEVWAKHVQTYLDGVMNTTYGGDAVGDTDVLFLWPVGNLSGDRFTLYGQYKTYALGLARSYGAALLDLNAMFHGSWNAWQKRGYAGNQADPTKAGSDFLHPSDAGAEFIATQVARLVASVD